MSAIVSGGNFNTPNSTNPPVGEPSRATQPCPISVHRSLEWRKCPETQNDTLCSDYSLNWNIYYDNDMCNIKMSLIRSRFHIRHRGLRRHFTHYSVAPLPRLSNSERTARPIASRVYGFLRYTPAPSFWASRTRSVTEKPLTMTAI